MSKYYTRHICQKEGCSEWTFTNHRTRKDQRAYEAKNRKWTCIRHSSPEKVLSNNKLTTKQTLIVDSNEHGNYWRVLGTKNLVSGFQHGNGYKAWAKDFPVGTTLTVSATIELPKIEK